MKGFAVVVAATSSNWGIGKNGGSKYMYYSFYCTYLNKLFCDHLQYLGNFLKT